MARPRKRGQVVPHLTGLVHLDDEPLFAALDVAGERAVGEAKSPRRAGFVDRVDDPRSVGPPQFQDAAQYDHFGLGNQRRFRRMDRRPIARKLPPLPQRILCGF
jgi:hypothetical protein